MTDAESYFHDLKDYIPNVKPGKMFGALCYKTEKGKSAGMFWKDSLVVKLPEPEKESALQLKGTALFEPMKGKPMKEWVVIPFAHKEEWVRYANLCADYVRELGG